MKMYERGELPHGARKRERKGERKKRDSSHCAVTKTYLARGLKGGEPSRDCGTLSYTT